MRENWYENAPVVLDDSKRYDIMLEGPPSTVYGWEYFFSLTKIPTIKGLNDYGRWDYKLEWKGI